VLMLDPANPQIAARLLSSLRSWRSLEPRRQSLAAGALGRVAAVAQLSPDVRDIVTRCLG
jgi:aminopeptidase N